MRPPQHRFSGTRQRGAALLLMLVIMVMGIAAVLVNSLSASAVKNARQETTSAALAQAKEALIGYAVTYRDKNHPNEVFGYLPLPDLGSSRNGTTQEGNAAANFSGNTKNLTVIGRLPWRTLGLPPLRDGHGECLWYAVSGSFQNAQKADVLNWDSLGHFDVYSSNGASGTISVTGLNYAQRPAAIVFSADAVLQGQDRQTSTTDGASTCGGNYDARNYLDSFNDDANISNHFAGSTNNSTGYAYNLTNTSNGSQLDAAALAAPKNIIFGDIEAIIAKIVNDRILTIATDDIFRIIKQRSDFETDISSMVSELAACLNAIPPASLPAASGVKGIDGPLSNPTMIACLNSDIKKRNIRNNWKDNLLYAKPGSPIVLNSSTCNAVLIFGGARTGAQVRIAAPDKANPTNYLEDLNVTSFPNGTSYSGATAYNKASPSSDIVACITGIPP